MIQSVGTTDTNAIKIAYEVDHKIGLVCSCPKQIITTYLTAQDPA